MSNDGSNNSAFLTAPGLIALFSRLTSRKGEISLPQLLNDVHSLHPADQHRIHTTVVLLEDLGWISITDDDRREGKVITVTCTQPLTIPSLADAYLRYLKAKRVLLEIIDAFQFDDRTGEILVDRLGFPWRLNHVRHFLRELKILERTDVDQQYWKVCDKFADAFLEEAQRANSQQLPHAISAKQLQSIQQTQSKLGAESEEWVLNRERQRLTGHPMLNHVRRISDEAVNAGYDIQSFSSPRSLRLDRFLEVKSFSDEPRFHWSENEIVTARGVGNRYFLVLVDRQRFSDPAYRPIEIQNPYAFFFEYETQLWEKRPTDWLLERTSTISQRPDTQ